MTSQSENDGGADENRSPQTQGSVISEEGLRSSQKRNNSDESHSQGPVFKKYPWLNNYFGYTVRGQETLVFCKACDKEYVSRSLDRLKIHYDKCKKINREVGGPVISEQNNCTNNEMNELWTQVCIENNIALRTIESKSFRAFANKLNQRWKLPSRYTISNVYIPKLSGNIRSKFMKDLKRGVIFDISVEFDHWKDGSKTDFLGVVATNHRGDTYLVDMIDVSRKDKTSEVIVDEMSQILRSLPINTVNALISDSAANCKKARRLLVEIDEFKSIIEHRCLAHLFNRVGSRITKDNRWISDAVTLASKITSWLTNSSFWLAQIQELQLRRPTTACPVRWYSTVNMLESLLDLHDVIMEDFAPTLQFDKAELIRSVDWIDLREILEVLRPINKCIGHLEKKDTSLGEAFREILNYARELFASTSPSEAMKAARKSFLWYFNTRKLSRFELGLYFAAYMMDPRFRGDHITKEGADLALHTIVKIGLKSGMSMQRLSSSVIAQDFDNYREFGDGYPPATSNIRALQYWQERSSLGPLARISIRLANLKATSANIERMFSTMSYIKGKHRNRLLNSNFIHMGRIKLNSKEAPEEHEDYDKCVEEELEDVISDDSSSESSQINTSSDPSSCNSSNITDYDHNDSSVWLENQDGITRDRYAEFCKYIDFSIENTCNVRPDESSSSVSDEQIMDAVRSRRTTQEAVQSGVIIDSASQMAAYGGLPDLEMDC